MKQICRNCHFLAKEYRDQTEAVHTFSLNEKEREKVSSHPSGVVNDRYSLKCHMGVWDEGVSCSKEERNSTINLGKRETSCFFFPYHPGMLFNAAQELQKRADELNQMKRSNLYTRIGLGIAATALLLNALVAYLKGP